MAPVESYPLCIVSHKDSKQLEIKICVDRACCSIHGVPGFTFRVRRSVELSSLAAPEELTTVSHVQDQNRFECKFTGDFY